MQEKYDGKLQKEMNGPTYEVVSKLMKAIVNKKVTIPGSFLGHSGKIEYYDKIVLMEIFFRHSCHRMFLQSSLRNVVSTGESLHLRVQASNLHQVRGCEAGEHGQVRRIHQNF